MEASPTRTRTTVLFEPEVKRLIEMYMSRTDRTFSGAVNWLVKRQLALVEQDPAQDIAS